MTRANTYPALLLLASLLVAPGASADDSPANDSTPNDAVRKPIGVEEFAKTVDGPGGPYLLEGVVSAVSAKKQMIALIDTSEFEKCGVTTCAPITVPVRWDGAMPAVRDIVELDGSVEEREGGKLVFVCKELREREPEKSDGGEDQ